MVSGLPRPATAGSASCAPLPASLRISGTGLISLPIGMNPETIVCGVIATGNGRSAMACAAAARMPAGNASRRARACRRSSALASSIEVD
jgi:hypothetical protein